MIVSIHLPKSAGTTFRLALSDYFKERIYMDYGDWIGDESAEAVDRRAGRLKELEHRLPDLISRTDCIHGHFYASKWTSLLDSYRFFTIFRDPFEAIPSGYAFLVRNPQIPQPFVKEFHETKMTFREYIIKWQNLKTHLIHPLGLADFAAIGLASDMPRTVELFKATFGTELQLPVEPLNPNPSGQHYPLERRNVSSSKNTTVLTSDYGIKQ
ncbi:MAG: hypothetical protein IPL46_33360 [Saprospiraceae bacterium]|nr:hypothetical protein [Saprospiraceae bacterium]